MRSASPSTQVLELVLGSAIMSSVTAAHEHLNCYPVNLSALTLIFPQILLHISHTPINVEQGPHGPVSERQQPAGGKEEVVKANSPFPPRHARARPSAPTQCPADALLCSCARSQVVMRRI
jgi:hypothetical protein